MSASGEQREPVLCLGDSHIRVFELIEETSLIPHARFELCWIAGATAQGIVNPNSQTHALREFEARLDRAPVSQTLVFQLGEVDCGFLIWYRAAKYGISIESQLESSLSNYCSFLDSVRARGFSELLVLSAPLPTVADGIRWGDVPNLRSEVTAPQRERTELTLTYNARLAERCLASGHRFVDVTSAQLDPKTGLIRRELLRPNPFNYHLDADRYARLIVRELGPMLLPSAG
jgi:hypothetical protein